jgi:hypothetical protein
MSDDEFPTSVCPDTTPHAPHRIAGTWRTECPGVETWRTECPGVGSLAEAEKSAAAEERLEALEALDLTDHLDDINFLDDIDRPEDQTYGKRRDDFDFLLRHDPKRAADIIDFFHDYAISIDRELSQSKEAEKARAVEEALRCPSRKPGDVQYRCVRATGHQGDHQALSLNLGELIVSWRHEMPDEATDFRVGAGLVCGAYKPTGTKWRCTRDAWHSGWHRAVSGLKVVASWPQTVAEAEKVAGDSEEIKGKATRDSGSKLKVYLVRGACYGVEGQKFQASATVWAVSRQDAVELFTFQENMFDVTVEKVSKIRGIFHKGVRPE